MPSAKAPAFTTLPADSTDEAILEAFDRDGAVIISGLLSQDSVRAIQKELKLESDAVSPQAITALASKSPTTVDQVILSEQLKRLLYARMSKTTRIWHGEDRLSNTSRPWLSATVVFETAPGEQAQPLHRHDDIYFVDHPLEIPAETWALIALDDEGSGEAGSMVDAILGSHRWDEEWDPSGHSLASTVLKRGDCLLLHGSTVHRGGENGSSRVRRTLGVSWTRGHMRQEENQFLNITKEQAMSLDERTQRAIGYNVNPPYGGWYELRDPITYLQAEETVDKTMREFLGDGENPTASN
ncbi:hypothetical protein A1O3_01825 [Capronia epimyces CBS 606.96]|uniref:Phytanoyl-CoA dioxygenase n=1 Tax=Capronia epimyces CBS 606.96 TaxID=1182542 RepID=W9YHL7_9EURO|nr:uncharacterized protein A1O3_01825 [Capronia epimyces CBS 606.96]EXJ88761.1 hypothetical protein A1O3_01825 [Capronia epimyces CBS 606.96]